MAIDLAIVFGGALLMLAIGLALRRTN